MNMRLKTSNKDEEKQRRLWQLVVLDADDDDIAIQHTLNTYLNSQGNTSLKGLTTTVKGYSLGSGRSLGSGQGQGQDMGLGAGLDTASYMGEMYYPGSGHPSFHRNGRLVNTPYQCSS